MLQRRQLATELESVQARCGTLPPTQSREAAIQRLQSEILELRKELDRTETELRGLRQQR
jgi:ribosomal protein S11